MESIYIKLLHHQVLLQHNYQFLVHYTSCVGTTPEVQFPL